MESFRQLAAEYPLRLTELVRYLRENGGGFPLTERLLQCSVAVGMGCRAGGDGRTPADGTQAICVLREVDYIIDMAVRAGYLSELQSRLILQDGRQLLTELEGKAWEVEEGEAYEKANES